jgi:hypothetical protein
MESFERLVDCVELGLRWNRLRRYYARREREEEVKRRGADVARMLALPEPRFPPPRAAQLPAERGIGDVCPECLRLSSVIRRAGVLQCSFCGRVEPEITS